MKPLLFVLAFGLITSALQAQTDTLQRLNPPKKTFGTWGYYRYGNQKIKNPRRLKPYFYASGDTTAIRLFEEYRSYEKGAKWSVALGGGAAIAGYALAIKDLSEHGLFGSSADSRHQEQVIGILIFGGLSVEIIGVVLSYKAHRVLKKSIARYNQARPPKVSWQLGPAPTGLGVGLSGSF